jgi:Iron-containing redox enzyme
VAKPVRNSEIVRAKIRMFGRRLGHTSYTFWTHREFPRLYREYIYQSHSIIRASVPLMQAAEQACGLPRYAGDAALQGFARYLRRHIPEETGHHEWILDDGEAMGLDRQSILRRVPKESATQLVGVQYYWIHHFNPIALAGFIATMEGDPPSAGFIGKVAARNKLPLRCFSSFLYHARIDPQHRRDLDDLLDSLPLTPPHLEWIGLSSLRTIRRMTAIMEDIIESGLSAEGGHDPARKPARIGMAHAAETGGAQHAGKLSERVNVAARGGGQQRERKGRVGGGRQAIGVGNEVDERDSAARTQRP